MQKCKIYRRIILRKSDLYFTDKPQYSFVEVRPEIPAERLDLEGGDLSLKINGSKAYNNGFSPITNLLISLDE
jgi:hypothetical protein